MDITALYVIAGTAAGNGWRCIARARAWLQPTSAARQLSGGESQSMARLIRSVQVRCKYPIYQSMRATATTTITPALALT